MESILSDFPFTKRRVKVLHSEDDWGWAELVAERGYTCFLAAH
jgi:hypothetical protein